MSMLDAIRARLTAATPGPWKADTGLEIFPLTTGGDLDIQGEICAVVSNAADADFIAHAPIDMEALLYLVDDLKAQLAAAERVVNLAVLVTNTAYAKSLIDLHTAVAAYDATHQEPTQ